MTSPNSPLCNSFTNNMCDAISGLKIFTGGIPEDAIQLEVDYPFSTPSDEYEIPPFGGSSQAHMVSPNSPLCHYGYTSDYSEGVISVDLDDGVVDSLPTRSDCSLLTPSDEPATPSFAELHAIHASVAKKGSKTALSQDTTKSRLTFALEEADLINRWTPSPSHEIQSTEHGIVKVDMKEKQNHRLALDLQKTLGVNIVPDMSSKIFPEAVRGDDWDDDLEQPIRYAIGKNSRGFFLYEADDNEGEDLAYTGKHFCQDEIDIDNPQAEVDDFEDLYGLISFGDDTCESCDGEDLDEVENTSESDSCTISRSSEQKIECTDYRVISYDEEGFFVLRGEDKYRLFYVVNGQQDIANDNNMIVDYHEQRDVYVLKNDEEVDARDGAVIVVGKNVKGFVQERIPDIYSGCNLLACSPIREELYAAIENDLYSLIEAFMLTIILRPQDGKFQDLDDSNYLCQRIDDASGSTRVKFWSIDHAEILPVNNVYSTREDYCNDLEDGYDVFLEMIASVEDEGSIEPLLTWLLDVLKKMPTYETDKDLLEGILFDIRDGDSVLKLPDSIYYLINLINVAKNRSSIVPMRCGLLILPHTRKKLCGENLAKVVAFINRIIYSKDRYSEILKDTEELPALLEVIDSLKEFLAQKSVPLSSESQEAQEILAYSFKQRYLSSEYFRDMLRCGNSAFSCHLSEVEPFSLQDLWLAIFPAYAEELAFYERFGMSVEEISAHMGLYSKGEMIRSKLFQRYAALHFMHLVKEHYKGSSS